MPYIQTTNAEELLHRIPENPGELNYLISRCLAAYVETHGLSYKTINDVSGAATEALAEFRRRLVVPYENLKHFGKGSVDPYVALRPDATETDQVWVNRVNRSVLES